MTKKAKKDRIKEAFVTHTLAMRRSPAWCVLPNHARRFLSCLEDEHMAHGGAQNGKLQATYEQLEAKGIPKKAIALAIRQCEALGFVEVMHRGSPSLSVYRDPSRYRLTYVYGRHVMQFGEHVSLRTDEWKSLATLEDAFAALEGAAQVKSEKHVRRAHARLRRAA